MKQFIVFIHSNFSKASIQCEKIINTLPSDLNINYLCIDNPKTRSVILQDSQLEIKLVPTILIVDVQGKVSKFEGKTCFDYLSQFKEEKKIFLQPLPPQPNPQVFQQQAPPPPPQPSQPVAPPSPTEQNTSSQQQIKKNKKPLPEVKEPINFDDELFNSQPPSDNITALSIDDDDTEETPQYVHPDTPPVTPLPPPSKQQQQKNNQKNNIVAQAQAMQKSRLQDEEFSKKKH